MKYVSKSFFAVKKNEKFINEMLYLIISNSFFQEQALKTKKHGEWDREWDAGKTRFIIFFLKKD